jgi:uncharacterized membrane protein YjgN (DUF898 family)
MDSKDLDSSQILQNTPFEFRGNALDFFSIWFVNMILTTITFGIYGAWAKVRTNQYIYGNTFLGGHSFEYTADPVKILIGRLIVAGIYIVFFVSIKLMFIQTAVIISILFMLLIPLIIRQALIFRAKYTRFHGLNFRFKASIGDFYKFFLWHTFLNLITIGIIFPYTHSEFKKLVLNNTYYGESNLHFPGKASTFFFIYYIKMMLLYIAFTVISAIFFFAFMPHPVTSNSMTASSIFSLILLTFILMPLVSFVVQGSFEAWIGRVVYNHTSIKEYRMLNEWSAPKLSWIYLSNFFVVIFSFGLLYPWTKIRTVRYKLENIGFENLDLHAFEGQVEQERNAIGEEAADFFDFDIGF